MGALKAISEASQRFAEKKSEGLFTSDGDVQKALATFWRTAWLPTAPDAPVHAANTALAGLPKYDKAAMAKNSPNELLFASLFARATAAVDAVAVAAPADVRVHTLRMVLDKHTKERAELVKAIARDAWIKRIVIAAVALTPFVLLYQYQTEKSEQRAKDHAAWQAKQDAEREKRENEDKTPPGMRGQWRHDKDDEMLVVAAESISLTKAEFGVSCGNCSGDTKASFTITGNWVKTGVDSDGYEEGYHGCVVSMSYDEAAKTLLISTTAKGPNKKKCLSLNGLWKQ